MDLFNELAQEAHDACTVNGRFHPRHVAEQFVALVQEQLGSGRQEIPTFLDRLAVDGAGKWLADYRRSVSLVAKTKKGNEVEVSAYAGIRDEDGQPVQM